MISIFFHLTHCSVITACLTDFLNYCHLEARLISVNRLDPVSVCCHFFDAGVYGLEVVKLRGQQSFLVVVYSYFV